MYNIATALLISISHRSFSTGFVERATAQDRENQSARREMADHKTFSTANQ